MLTGASGPLGKALSRHLLAGGWRVLALSRQAAGQLPQPPGLEWLQGSLETLPPLSVRLDAIISAGPLDAFARWFQRAAPDTPRVLAFSSTSIHSKRDSSDAGERAMIARLLDAEQCLQHSCETRGIGLTLLRPTLIYGDGGDRSLSRIVALARRYGFCLLPHDARGLRQPVHVEDLASAALACLARSDSIGRSYALGGGEVLDYTAMVQRVLALLSPPPRLWRVPGPLFSALLWLARASGRVRGFTPAMRQRMRQDLVFDHAPAQRDLGYAPRPFQPDRTLACPLPEPAREAGADAGAGGGVA